MHGLCAPPKQGLLDATTLGLDAVASAEYDATDLDGALNHARDRDNSEGSVVYCVGNGGLTVGLWKVKTVWYVFSRAIRQKVMAWNINRIDSRMREIQQWLKLDDETTLSWTQRAHRLVAWLRRESQQGRLDWKDFMDTYPRLCQRCDADVGFVLDENQHWLESRVIMFAFHSEHIEELPRKLAKALGVFVLEGTMKTGESIKMTARDYPLFVCAEPMSSPDSRKQFVKAFRKANFVKRYWVVGKGINQQPKTTQYVPVIEIDPAEQDLTKVVSQVKTALNL